MYNLKQLFTTLLLSSLSTVLFAQGSQMVNGSLSGYLLKRYEVKSGTLRNNIFTDLYPLNRKEASQYINDLQLDSTAQIINSYTDDDLLNYLVNDNLGWTNGDFNNSKKPILKSFYKSKANFYSVNEKDFQLFANPVFLYTMGVENPNQLETDLFKNERGVEVRGNIQKKISFYTYFTDNQARYGRYVREWMAEYKALPGEGFYKGFNGGVDHYTARGHIAFNATPYLTINFGNGRNFIGNGTRSLLLSDFAKDYVYLKLNTKIWRFNYQNLFTELTDRQSTSRTPAGIANGKKYMASHYLSLDILKNLNIGLFENIIFYDADSTGRGFEAGYANPIIFYRAVEHGYGSIDNAVIGLNINYLPYKGYQLYGQLLLDEFKFGEITQNHGWSGNKYGIQLGFNYMDFLTISNLDFNIEFNTVRPFTYSHQSSGSNYAHYNQPLAHPFGSNFKEFIQKFIYMPNAKLKLESWINYSRLGLDEKGTNVGSNILYDIRTGTTPLYGNFTGQGLKGTLLRFDLRASYMLRHNLFIDFDLSRRSLQVEDNNTRSYSSYIINAGIRWNAIPKNLYF